MRAAADTKDADWLTTIDGQPTVHLADGAFRGVWITSGRHEVLFHHAPRRFRLGVLIAALAAVSCLLLCMAQRGKTA
jgi:hypothetical protein